MTVRPTWETGQQPRPRPPDHQSDTSRQPPPGYLPPGHRDAQRHLPPPRRREPTGQEPTGQGQGYRGQAGYPDRQGPPRQPDPYGHQDPYGSGDPYGPHQPDYDERHPPMGHREIPRGRREVKAARMRSKAQQREARWQRNRYAVPYRTDGPRLTFGVIWFSLLAGAVFLSPILVAVLVSIVAGLAALQATYAWFPPLSSARLWAAAAGFVGGLGGFLGGLGVVAGLGLATAICLVYGVAFPSRYPVGDLIGGLVRSAIPPALAAGSLAALTERDIGAVVALVAMVSAYEVGDYLVGTGSNNAVEGPVSGIVALSSVVFILWIVVPASFTQQGIVLFGILTALCCPLGQVLASALLPRGAAWAPALRRLDSYLVAAPLWLLLLAITPVAETV